ncbi:MAG: ferritin-like domain-containing protein [Gaiellaceae bacterium]
MSDDVAGISGGSTVKGDTRARFLRKAAFGGVSLAGAGALLGSGAGIASAATDDGVSDVDVLNFALTLEYLEASYYVQALGTGSTPLPPGVAATPRRFTNGQITGAKQLQSLGNVRAGAYRYLRQIRDHEVAHVAFLQGALGAAAVPACTFDFSAPLDEVDTFLATALVLENTGVMAYDGAIRYIETPDNLQAGAQIATIEARHASYLGTLNHAAPWPGPFDMGKKPSEIVAAVLATGLVVSCPQPVLDLFAKFAAAGA